jgi:hypothetical protein
MRGLWRRDRDGRLDVVDSAAPPDARRSASIAAARGALMADQAQIDLARALRGKYVRWNHDTKTHPGYLVIGVTPDGMVEIQGFTGHFAPDLFVRVDHPHSAAEGNC